MTSDRVLRLLCWALIVFTIATAVMQLTVSQNPFATPVDDSVDLVDRLLSYRNDDQRIFGLALVGAISGMGLYMVGGLIGVALRRLAPSGVAGDVMAAVFLFGGTLGVASQLIYIANAEFATARYCDCGYMTYEVISQGYALDMAWNLQSWVNIGAIAVVGLAAALAGWVVNLSRDWRILSYLIAIGALVAVALRLFDLGQMSDIVIGLVAGIAVPIWAFLLARGSGKLATQS